MIYAQNTIIPLTKQYRVKEEKYQPNKDYLVYYPQIGGMANMVAQEQVNKRLKELSQVKKIDKDVQLDYQPCRKTPCFSYEDIRHFALHPQKRVLRANKKEFFFLLIAVRHAKYI
nr:hypothetical protein [Brevibacillus laterosporus]